MSSLALVYVFAMFQYAIFKAAPNAAELVARIRDRLLQAAIGLPRANWHGWRSVAGLPYGALVPDPSVILGTVRCAGMS